MPPTHQTSSGRFAHSSPKNGDAPSPGGTVSTHHGPLIVPVQRVSGSPAQAAPPPVPAAPAPPDPAAPPVPAPPPVPAAPAPPVATDPAAPPLPVGIEPPGPRWESSQNQHGL